MKVSGNFGQASVAHMLLSPVERISDVVPGRWSSPT